MPVKPPPAPASAGFYSAENYVPGESLGWLIKRVHQSIVQQAGKRLADHGLTHAQWLPLFRLYFSGACPAAQLASDLELDGGALTRLLDRLEAKQLIQRERSSSDRRVVMVDLSPAGRELAQGLPGVLSEVFNLHLAGFTEAEWQTLMNLLRRLLANAEQLRSCETKG